MCGSGENLGPGRQDRAALVSPGAKDQMEFCSSFSASGFGLDTKHGPKELNLHLHGPERVWGQG